MYKSDGTLVDTIDVSDAVVTAGGETQTVISKYNTEIDKIGANLTSTVLSGRYRSVYYTPVTILGNTASIKLHDGVLAYGVSYYVTVDSSVFSGATLGGSTWAGISSSTAWTFTTKSAPASSTSVTVSATGSSADFRSVQGALNWIMEKCSSGGTDSTCNTSSVAKTITIADGTYNELLFMRNVSNITITGTTRAGTIVQYENYEHYNPGSGGSATSVATTLTTEGSLTRRALGGGRSVFLIEGGDLIKLTTFTLKNTHVKSSSLNNQAETIYYNSATTTGSRLSATYMNFISAQDTLQIKGWSWFYQSYIAGDVDFIWGYPYAAMFENCTVHTVVDPTNTSSGGYIVQSRAYAGYPGFVFLNSTLEADSGVSAGTTYLARTGGTCSTYSCDNVAYINTTMASHIASVGWYGTPNLTNSATTGWRESGTTGVDTSSRTGGSTAMDLSGLNTRTKVFSLWNTSTGWIPAP